MFQLILKSVFATPDLRTTKKPRLKYLEITSYWFPTQMFITFDWKPWIYFFGIYQMIDYKLSHPPAFMYSHSIHCHMPGDGTMGHFLRIIGSYHLVEHRNHSSAVIATYFLHIII